MVKRGLVRRHAPETNVHVIDIHLVSRIGNLGTYLARAEEVLP